MSEVENKHRTAALSQWNGTLPYTYEGLQLAALMAILDELKEPQRRDAVPEHGAHPSLPRAVGATS